MITIESIQIGSVVTEGDPHCPDPLQRQWTTAFYKYPVAGSHRLTRTGLQGDGVGNPKAHGGPDKAILCYASTHYQRWQSEYPQLHMSAGGLAENLTLTGTDESTTCLGDRYRVGDCEIEVSSPRQPCWKIARRWGIKTLTKDVAENGRTGWYARVIDEGQIEAGMELKLIARPHKEWTVARANDVLFGREVDRMAVIDLMNLAVLADGWKASLA